jgi:hypothetical protein
MRGPGKPSEWRWLNGAVFGAPFLVLGLLPIVVEDTGCLVVVRDGNCLNFPEDIYGGLLCAAAGCFLLCLYRAYRDFYKGDLERDVAKW